MVHRALDELVAVVMVNARVPGVHPVAVATGVDQECGHRAVRLFLRGYGRQLDDDVGLLHQLHQHGGGIIRLRRVAFKQLAHGHHHLVGRLAAAAAPAHAISHHGQHAAVNAGVVQQGHLVLLVFAVALMDAGGSGESVAFEHLE